MKTDLPPKGRTPFSDRLSTDEIANPLKKTGESGGLLQPRISCIHLP